MSINKEYHFKNLHEIFNKQINDAITSFPEITFSAELNDLRDKSCNIVVFKNLNDEIKNLFLEEDYNNILDFIDCEKFNEIKETQFKHIKIKINKKFTDLFLVKIVDNEKTKNLNNESLFKKLAIIIKKKKITGCNLIFDKSFENKNLILDALKGLIFNNFYFTLKNIKDTEGEMSKISHINIINSANLVNMDGEIDEIKKLSHAIFMSKILSIAPANIINPETFCDFIMKDLKENNISNISAKFITENEMIKLGMNALVGVGLGSKSESRLMILEYNGAPSKKEKIALIGKGITFDTGGLSIKGGDYMEGMKYDKSGGSCVFGALRAVASRNAKVNLIGIIPLAENAVSDMSQRPDDIVVSMSGQTIDIRNTDAEGRLILADAITYAQRFYNPTHIIDIATLTGAMKIALGSNLYAGLFSNNDKISNELLDSGIQTGEMLWRMPLHNEYNKRMNSDIADMQNISNSKGFGGGSITAAQFLQRFIENEDILWAHIDIANVDNLSSNTESDFYGSCGFGVRLFNDFIKKYE